MNDYTALAEDALRQFALATDPAWKDLSYKCATVFAQLAVAQAIAPEEPEPVRVSNAPTPDQIKEAITVTAETRWFKATDNVDLVDFQVTAVLDLLNEVYA